MLQQEHPEDFVIATGKSTSVRDFIRMAFQEAGLEIEFRGTGLDETGVVTACTAADCRVAPETVVVRVDPRYFRPSEVEILMGDASKARRQLNWKPKYDLEGLVREMVAADLELFRKDKYLREGGHRTFNYNE